MSLGLSLTDTRRKSPGWYRGDLHAHTFHSDGALAPEDLARTAREEGLDFLAITDHNSIAAYPHFGANPGVLMIPGVEVTRATGHFNVFGIESQSDWLTAVCNTPAPSSQQDHLQTMSQIMQQTGNEALLNSINHPLLVPWAWLDAETDLRRLHCLEIWNDPSWPDNVHGNPAAVALWTEWLNAGYRITGIGGSDFHRPVPLPGLAKPAERLGRPSTYVFAAELSGRAILEGLRLRRAYVSMGAEVSFQAIIDGKTAGIGGDLGAVAGELRFEATVNAEIVPAVARLVKNGQTIAEQAITKPNQQWVPPVDGLNPTAPAWYRLDVYTPDEQMLAITNPIFTGPNRQPERHLFGDFVATRT